MSTIFTVYKLQPISDEMDSRPYIGATGNYRMRIHFHRSDYKRYPNRPVYSAMRANGGFENYRPVIVEQFLESDYEEGVAMRLASNREAKLVGELIPLKGCLNRELPGRSGRDSFKAWRAAKIAADPDGFRDAVRSRNAAWRAKKMSADPDGFRASASMYNAAWRAKKMSADPDGFRASVSMYNAAWRAKKMSADLDGYRAAHRCAMAAWRAKKRAEKLAAASD
jgi:hypothetical protein